MASRQDKPLPPLPTELPDLPIREHPTASSSNLVPRPAPRVSQQPPRPRNNSRPQKPTQPLRASDSSSESDDFAAARPSRPARHARSMSHPFPSFFSSLGKKKHVNNRVEPPIEESEPDQSPGWTPKAAPRPQPVSSNSARKFPPTPADFSTGNCMTCASLVRWPKELHVFRCTICLTINDLKPLDLNQPGRNGEPAPVPKDPRAAQEKGLGPSIPTRQPPNSISLEHTRSLVKNSLRSSLKAFVFRGEDEEERPERAWQGHQPPKRAGTDYLRHRKGSSQLDASLLSNRTHPSDINQSSLDDATRLNMESNALNISYPSTQSLSTSFPETRGSAFHKRTESTPGPGHRHLDLDPKKVFKTLEDYLIACFGAHSCINNSFVTRRMSVSSRQAPEPPRRRHTETRREQIVPEDAPISELDPKLLLLGDVAENGSWWLGPTEDSPSVRSSSPRKHDGPSVVTSKSPSIDWGQVMEWYHVLCNTAQAWHEVYEETIQADPSKTLSDFEQRRFEGLVLQAQEHIQRSLLKCNEMLLKRPRRLMAEPRDVRFLLILLANPLIHSGYKSYGGRYQQFSGKGKAPGNGRDADRQATTSSGRHSGIIKRILGLLANSSELCHHHLITWFSRLPDHLFLQIKDTVSGFVTYRLVRQNEKKVEQDVDLTGGLIPQMPDAHSNPASLHAALEISKNSKKQKAPIEPKRSAYTDDWQIRAGARVMGLIFWANNVNFSRQSNDLDGRRPLLSTSDFYNSLVDCLDFKADFELWESKRGKFTFCQYPFFLSIWAKIQILEHDAKRQMRGKAREAFFDSILTHKNYAQYLVLNIRRDCLVEDSLTKVSEVVGSGSEDIKKALRIEFRGEEGFDAGGLRKEWFLLLVREVFNPDHGLFVYDEDSQVCYFNPHTFETSDQYFLVGVVLGLAIYNSTILDIALPPFAFRKLLASAPPPASGIPSHSRPTINYTLEDLAEYRPSLAKGLRQLLDFEGDVQSVFCLDFVIEAERYGTRIRTPLCPGGEHKMVTNANRREYVDLYVRYLLDTSVARQFEPFKRGFFTVTAGNALTLFRPEEIELLVRGSDEPLDIASLKAVAEYQNWPKGSNAETQPVLRWFWESFEQANPKSQRRLLSFITGSDRIPATGATSLVIRINCLGDDDGRFPSARTCFNMLSLYRFNSKERLEQSLWTAVNESEGFGLK